MVKKNYVCILSVTVESSPAPARAVNIGTLTASVPKVSPPRSLLIIRVVNVVLIYLTKFPNFKILKAAHQ